MTTQPEHGVDAAHLMYAAAVRAAARHGFEETTAGELADAMGISRSTFFRRFGSKDDVIFSDHEFVLGRLRTLLDATQERTTAAVIQGAMEVMQLLIRDRDTALLRWQLLRENQPLRDREIIVSHRYERLISEFLARVAATGTPDWAPNALAAAMVAAHNMRLRVWLREPVGHPLTVLERDLTSIVELFSPWYGDAHEADTRVVVATFSAQTHPEEVMQAISEQLTR